jgi:hypothetical protein
MHRSLLLLSKLRLIGQLRRLRRTLSTPRGLLLALAATVLFGMFLLPYVVTRGVATAAPQEQMPYGTWVFHPAALFAYWLFTIAGGHFQNPVAFGMPEVEFLFPGPFTRRELVIYKLASVSVGTLGIAVLMPLFLPMLWGSAGLVGVWLMLTFMQWSSVLVVLVASWLGARYRPVLVAAVLTLGMALAASAWQSGALDSSADLIERLRALETSAGGRALLAPFEVFSHAITSRSIVELVPWSAAALVLTSAVGGCSLVLDRHFLEASLEASRRRYEMLEQYKRSGGMPTIGRRGKPRVRLPAFPRLAGAGPIAWRQALEMLRGSGRLIIVAAVIIAPVAAMITAVGQREGRRSPRRSWPSRS